LASLPLGHAVAGFALMTGVLVLVSPQLVHAAREIAVLTGLGTGLIGVTLFAFVTSLPEVITMITAARLGAFDMTVGDLLGSNVFNMLALAITDIFYLQGRLLNDVDENFALAGFIVLFLINLALIGNLARLEQRLWFIEVDVLLIILTFIGGLLLLFEHGVGL
ncbi:MAG: hypothetical protein J7M05_11055, partial [Anaerolineae bacterium]|nr:hypothetical protein [Anaerolineae bacterium]